MTNDLDPRALAATIIELTGRLHEIDDYRQWLSKTRAEAIYTYSTLDNPPETLSSIASRAGVSRQVFSRIVATERAERGDI